jgi:cell shape-determining protein MreC
MERRMEASKKQADALADLEDQLSKARKQEKAYEEAMEQLQADLDTLEQENGRLKQSLNTPDRQGKPYAHEFVPEVIGGVVNLLLHKHWACPKTWSLNYLLKLKET